MGDGWFVEENLNALSTKITLFAPLEKL